MNKDSLKKTKKNEMRAEYDFAAMKGGIRGKYAQHDKEETQRPSHRTRTKRG